MHCCTKRGKAWRQTALRTVFIAAALLLPGGAIASDDVLFSPQTKLRIKVFQWSAMKGTFEEWSALGGEFTVSAVGTIDAPVVGSVSVVSLDIEALARVLTERLQAKVGLVAPPEIAVEIVDHPPIYILGDVTAPGEYRYRPGMTALQALALGGGGLRVSTEEAKDQLLVATDLKDAENAILLSQAKIARLDAERSGASTFAPSTIRLETVSAQRVADVFDREQIIFAARKKELRRQEISLGELRELLKAEIGVLEQKVANADKAIAAAEKELTAVTGLVDKGIVVSSRKSDLERLLSSFHSSRLDYVTAGMRARQGLAAATRDFEGLQDKFQTSVSSEFQDEQALLEKNSLKRDLARKLLATALAPEAAPPDPKRAAAITYTITRNTADGQVVMPAEEGSPIRPGDVLRVTVTRPQQNAAKPSIHATSGSGPISMARRIGQ